MVSKMGFHSPKEKEETELEIKLKVKFVDEEDEPFPAEIGRQVKLYLLPQGCVIGVYRGLNEKGYYVLQPSITTEFTPESKTENNKGRTTSIFSERPTYIRRDLVGSLGPIREEYFEELKRGNTLEREHLEKYFKSESPEYQI